MQANFWDRNQLKLAPVFFLAPAMLLFAVYVLYPIFSSLRISFFEWDGVGEMIWIGFGNYIEMWEDDRVHTAIKNNFIWLICFLLAPPLSLALGIFLNQNLTELKFIKSLFFFPFVVSPVVVGLIFSWFYNPKYGLLDSFLEFIGLNSLAVLSNENIVTFGIIIAALWPQIAYCLILYLTGLAGLNKEIVEAAKIDGAKGWSMFWNVILPQLRPATFIAVIVSVLGALRSFDLVAIMTRGGPWGSSTVLAYEMVEQAIFNYRMGYGAALATILFLILDIYIAWFLIRVWLNEKGRL
ncbi:MAG: sugar ABC transporter permease [Deltaproteobacteria bacterium]|jgi:multiple sugar transport system permease protein|nr:sugar ABC transporter permease [Deltaproteobacteria bacterium]MEC9068995.1 sugar ABC transporter permease [SAR324 cluster bacterium]HAF88444.1 sugar ABC transporter permease [Deltaproteobacteria bacterium]|tara:strand:+ start:688 stop:1575 length:888 start_codon:yes stop_codon:yes gene_type:complete